MYARAFQEFGNVQRSQLSTPGMDSSFATADHGTSVASLAVGRLPGVAPRANLISVAMGPFSAQQWVEALAVAYTDIQKKPETHGKAVINMSWGIKTRDIDHGALEVWKAIIKKFSDLGVVMVAAAGNYQDGVPRDEIQVGDFDSIQPASFSNEVPGLISVGAVSSYGMPTSFSPCAKGSGTDSSCITVFAKGAGVLCAYNTSQYSPRDGAAYAAPQIAGLAAYILSHPSALIQQHIPLNGTGGVGGQVADIIKHWSYSRGDSTDGSKALSSPKVAWNGAIEDMCSIGMSTPGDKKPEKRAGTIEGRARQPAGVQAPPSDIQLSPVSRTQPKDPDKYEPLGYIY